MNPPEKCGCGQKLLWARTERSRWIPLNGKPDPKGNQAAWQDSDGIWKTRQLTEKSDPKWGWETLYMPHAATCPGRRPAAPKPDAGPLPANVVPFSALRDKLRARQGRP